MNSSNRILMALSLLLLAQFGCSSPWGIGNANAPPPPAARHALAPPMNIEPIAPQPQVNEQELSAVLAELEEIGTLDPELKKRIIEDLRETKPELWGPTVQVYRGALAYRQQVEKREALRPADSVGYQTNTPAANPETPAAQPQSAATTKLPPVESAASTESELPPRSADPAVQMRQVAQQVVQQEFEKAVRQQSPRSLPPLENSVIETNNVLRAAEKLAATDLPMQTQPLTTQPLPTQPSQAQAMTPTRRDEQVHQVAARAERLPQTEMDWQAHLQQSIEGLDSISTDSARDDEELSRQVALRLLNLAASNREEALRPIEGVSSAQQDYWQKQIFSIATNVDTAGIPDPRQRAAAARRHLEDANVRLGELSGLAARNLAFCTEISSYGVFEPFTKSEFHPGQEVLLYAEVENFKSVPSEKGYTTKLRSSYQILDSRGARVFDDDFATTEDVCRNRRRDFFMRYRIWIPKRIFDGEYTLKLTIEDEAKQEIGQSSIDFTITEKNS